MNFDLGIYTLRKALTPKTYTLRCTVLESGNPMKVQCTLNTPDEKHLDLWAKPLLSQSYTYEVGDEVIVEVRSLCEAYVVGLAAELDGVNTEEEFCLRFGKLIVRGRRDGSEFTLSKEDNTFSLEHTPAGTSVSTTGVLSLVGDAVTLGDGLAPALNCMTACPLTGLHASTQTKVFL